MASYALSFVPRLPPCHDSITTAPQAAPLADGFRAERGCSCSGTVASDHGVEDVNKLRSVRRASHEAEAARVGEEAEASDRAAVDDTAESRGLHAKGVSS
jgi:hypothetical protein